MRKTALLVIILVCCYQSQFSQTPSLWVNAPLKIDSFFHIAGDSLQLHQVPVLKTNAKKFLENFFKRKIAYPKFEKPALDTFFVLCYYKEGTDPIRNYRLLIITNLRADQSRVYFNNENELDFSKGDFIDLGKSAEIRLSNSKLVNSVFYARLIKASSAGKISGKMRGIEIPFALISETARPFFIWPENIRIRESISGKVKYNLDFENEMADKWIFGACDYDLDGLFNTREDYLFFLTEPGKTIELYNKTYCRPPSGYKFLKVKSAFYTLNINYQANGSQKDFCYLFIQPKQGPAPNKYMHTDKNKISESEFEAADGKNKASFASCLDQKRAVYVKNVNTGKEWFAAELQYLISLSEQLKDSLIIIGLIDNFDANKKALQLKKLPGNLILVKGNAHLKGEFDILRDSLGVLYDKNGFLRKDRVSIVELERLFKVKP